MGDGTGLNRSRTFLRSLLATSFLSISCIFCGFYEATESGLEIFYSIRITFGLLAPGAADFGGSLGVTGRGIVSTNLF
jgi:hypothetical protein